jgi:hypothetical protein
MTNGRLKRRDSDESGRRARGRATAATSMGIVCAALVLTSHLATADEARPPCSGSAPFPEYGLVGEAPVVRTWPQLTPATLAVLGGCVTWPTSASRLIVAVAGRFRSSDDVDGLLARFGAVSDLPSMRYWSVTDRSWRPLVTSSTALIAAVAGQPRGDFASPELRSGHEAYFAQRDSRGASEAVYWMRVQESTAGRIVIDTGNVTPIRWWGLTLFGPGDLRSVYILDQQEPNIWSYYSLTRIAGNGWLTGGHDKSYVNRIVAMYRHLASIPSDLEPPPAP